jgi:hypothetical protein
MKGMIEMALVHGVPFLLAQLDEATMKRAADGLLDVIEDAVESTPNKIDDAVVLPLVRKLRQAFDVADLDDDAPGGRLGGIF